MAGRVLVGTCSWTDRTLIKCGRFYPPGAASPAERLGYYASQFPLVEVDSSYYALPSQRNAALWAQRTPEGFLFDVKAFPLLTHHPTPTAALPRELRDALPGPLRGKERLYYRDVPPEVREEVWRLFQEALLPLDSAGKLGVVLFQFPPWFPPGPQSQDYILETQRRLPGYQVAVEFRAAGWLALGPGEAQPGPPAGAPAALRLRGRAPGAPQQRPPRG